MLFLKTYLTSLITTSVGFKKTTYFISLGYGFSVAGIGLFLLISQKNLTLGEILLGILYILYGLRLSIFLLIRDLKSVAYNQKMSEERKSIKEMKLSGKIMMWMSCALLYSCQSSPLTFRFISDKQDNNLLYIGIIISFLGFFLEAKADHEKKVAKSISPNRFVNTGLYKLVRCPNYFGEMLFWIGNFISGIKIYNGFVQWIVSLFGLICILYVMLGGTRKLEIRQNKSYGNDLEYQEYVKTTPILIPFIPLYSFENCSCLKG